MRIIGGQSRGLHLSPLGAGDLAARLRPTSDRVREAIFNLLVNGGYGDPVTGAQVLDLFAGTGALGLEALSRGAARACFVEDGAVALGLLRRNIGLMRAEARTEILRRDATRLGAARLEPARGGAGGGSAFDLVFLDPPYGRSLGEAALASAQAAGWLAAGAMVVWEEGAAPVIPAGFDRLDQRKYGDTVVTLLRGAAPVATA